MSKRFSLLLAFATFSSLSVSVWAENDQPAQVEKEIRGRAQIWNEAFQKHDLSLLSEVLSPDFQFTSAGGKCTSSEQCTRGFLSLLKLRPDLSWVTVSRKIDINTSWLVAHESGDWTESWTEKDGRVIIDGKYSALWKKNNDRWSIHATIFTPLSCTGESAYCRPRATPN